MLNKKYKLGLRQLLIVALLTVAVTACNRNKSTAHSGHDMNNMSMEDMEMPDTHDKSSMNLTDNDSNLNFALKPTNEYVKTTTDLVTLQKSEEPIEVEALGRIAYDTRQVGTISARISGRIEKLYVRYRYQKVTAGQKIMDIYSPEILTAEQNLLFLLKNDAANTVMLNAAKDKLLLLGVSNEQLNQVIKRGKPSYTVSVYSKYTGHIHEAVEDNSMSAKEEGMKDISLITEELSLKQGMYVEKGQNIFSVYNPDRAWAVLSFYSDKHSMIRQGDYVNIIPETAPSKRFRAQINFIEPFFQKESKTVTARVYFDNSQLQIPIGSQVHATIFGEDIEADWLPSTAVLSLGLNKIAFVKSGVGFKAHNITTGISYKDKIQVLAGLSPKDSVVANAQYLMDSEGFIKVKE